MEMEELQESYAHLFSTNTTMILKDFSLYQNIMTGIEAATMMLSNQLEIITWI